MSTADLARLRVASTFFRASVITDAVPTLGTETPPDRDAYRATIQLLAAGGDVAANPQARIARAPEAGWGFSWPQHAGADGVRTNLLGSTFTSAGLLPFKPVPVNADDRYRRSVVLACASILWDLGNASNIDPASDASTARAGGNLFLAAGVAVTLAGIAALAIVVDDYAVRSLQERTRIDLVRTAVVEYSARLRTFRETGTLPPPGPGEVVAESAIRERSESFLGRLEGAARSAGGAAKWLAIGGALVLVASSGMGRKGE